MILLSALATILPATTGGPPADPLTTPEVIKPEWWFYVDLSLVETFGTRTVCRC